MGRNRQRTPRLGRRGHRLAARAIAVFTAILGLAVSIGACARQLPSGPSPNAANVAGRWAGPASDSSGPGEMTWELTQSGVSFSGTMSMIDGGSGVSGRGSVAGTVSGSSIQFTISVPAGGFGEPFAACSASVSGDAQVSSQSISGSYSGSNSCAGPVAAGQLTLNRQ